MRHKNTLIYRLMLCDTITHLSIVSCDTITHLSIVSCSHSDGEHVPPPADVIKPWQAGPAYCAGFTRIENMG
jgi:hypothetical protein